MTGPTVNNKYRKRYFNIFGGQYADMDIDNIIINYYTVEYHTVISI